MALQKAQVPVYFTAGIDTKTDQKIVQGDFLEAQNIVYPAGIPNKRNGYLPFSTEGLTEGKALATFNEELLNFGQSRVRSYAEPIDEWIDRGEYVALNVTQNNIVRNSHRQTNPDISLGSGTVSLVWDDYNTTDDSLNGSYCSVYAQDDEVYYLNAVQLSSDGMNPKTLISENKAIFFFVDGTTLKQRHITFSDPTTLVSEITVLSDIHADGNYEVMILEGDIIVVYKDVLEKIRVQFIGVDGDNSRLLTNPRRVKFLNSITLTDDSTGSLGLATSGTGTETIIMIAHVDTTNIIRTGFSTLLLPSVTEGRVAGTIVNNTSISVIADGSMGNLYYDQVQSTSARENTFITTSSVTSGSTTSTGTTILRGVGLSSKAFAIGGIEYFVVTHNSTLQPTHFVSNEQGVIVARFNAGSAGVQRTDRQLASAVNDGSKIYFPATKRDRVITADNRAIHFTQGITETILNFGDFTYSTDQLENNLFINGGYIYSYDGRKLVENNFHLYPENLGADATGRTQGSGSSYYWRAIYTWTDGQGYKHRSAPSLDPAQTNNLLNTTVNNPKVTVPTLRMTQKENRNANGYLIADGEVKIELYRTIGGALLDTSLSNFRGTVFYKVAELDNDPTADTVEFFTNGVAPIDGVSGVNLRQLEPLYTEGNILEDTAPPQANIIATHKNRVFLAGLENDNLIAYSKLTGDGNPVGFNLDLTIPVEQRGGPIRAMISMDDWLVILKRDNIYILSGDGPLNNGTGSFYPQPRLIATDVGCIDQNSVVLTPLGVMFKSQKGIYLLTRQLKAEYVGANVQGFNNLTVTNASLVDDANEVRFTTNSDTVLVYNYYYNFWSTFNSITAVDADIWKTQYVYLQADGKVLRETPNYYKDEGKNVSMKLKTSWIKLSGLSGFQRVYWLQFVGEYKSKHSLNIFTKYDYKDYGGDQYLYRPDADFDYEFGGDSTFGGNVIFGSTDEPTYDFRVKPSTQKCEAIQIEISDNVDDDTGITGGESFNLTAVTLEIGQKSGLYPLRGSKTV